jgi:hypothetical protein
MILPTVKDCGDRVAPGKYILVMNDDQHWAIYIAADSLRSSPGGGIRINTKKDYYFPGWEESRYQYEYPDEGASSYWVYTRDIRAVFDTKEQADAAAEALVKLDAVFAEDTKAARLKYQLGTLMAIEQNT